MQSVDKVLRRKKGVLGGVAAGIADYFGFSVRNVRIALVLTALGGAGILFYIGLWIAIPEEGWVRVDASVPAAAPAMAAAVA